MARPMGIAYRDDGGWPRVRAQRVGIARRITGEQTEGHRMATVAVALAIIGLPLLKPHGPINSAPIDLLVLVAIGATLLWAGTANVAMRLPYSGATAVLVLAGVIASLAGPYARAGLAPPLQDIAVLAWCGALANVARTPGALRVLLRAWAWSAIAWAIVLLLAYATGHKEIAGLTAAEGPRAALTFDDPNLAANYFVVSFFVVLAGKVPANPWLRLGGCLTLLGALALTFSTGGMASLVLGLAILGLAAIGRRYRILALFAGIAASAILGASVYTLLNSPQVGQLVQRTNITLVRVSIGRSAHSVQERSTLIDEAGVLYMSAAPLGLGANAYRTALYDVQAPYVHEAHDDYVAALVEGGVLGAVGMLLLVGAVATRAWSVVRYPLSSAFRAAVPNPTALVAAAAAVALSAGFYQVLHFRHVWALFAVIAAVHQWGRQRPP